MTYENPFAWKRPDLVSSAVFRVPAVAPQSTIGSDGTFWSTWGYSKNFSAHQFFMTSYVNIDYILQGHATKFSCSKPHRPTENEQDKYASKSNALVSWHVPKVPPLRLFILASHDSVWSSPFPIGQCHQYVRAATVRGRMLNVLMSTQEWKRHSFRPRRSE